MGHHIAYAGHVHFQNYQSHLPEQEAVPTQKTRVVYKGRDGQDFGLEHAPLLKWYQWFIPWNFCFVWWGTFPNIWHWVYHQWVEISGPTSNVLSISVRRLGMSACGRHLAKPAHLVCTWVNPLDHITILIPQHKIEMNNNIGTVVSKMFRGIIATWAKPWSKKHWMRVSPSFGKDSMTHRSFVG